MPDQHKRKILAISIGNTSLVETLWVCRRIPYPEDKDEPENQIIPSLLQYLN